MSKIRTSFLALAVLAGTLGAAAAPALAADWGHRDAPAYRWDSREWRLHHPPVVFAAPYAAPVPAYVPPVYAAPVYAPPVYAPPAAALSVTIPFRF